MVRVVECHTGVLGLNLGGPKRFFPLELLHNTTCNSDFKLTVQLNLDKYDVFHDLTI